MIGSWYVQMGLFTLIGWIIFLKEYIMISIFCFMYLRFYFFLFFHPVSGTYIGAWNQDSRREVPHGVCVCGEGRGGKALFDKCDSVFRGIQTRDVLLEMKSIYHSTTILVGPCIWELCSLLVTLKCNIT